LPAKGRSGTSSLDPPPVGLAGELRQLRKFRSWFLTAGAPARHAVCDGLRMNDAWKGRRLKALGKPIL
jgi:hypothetical protein